MPRCSTAVLLSLIAATLVLSQPAVAQQGAVEGALRDSERQSSRRTPSALRGIVPSLFDPNLMQRDVVDLRLLTPPLERPIDPETYLVGPGDNFFVTLGEQSQGYALTVTPEGLLVIPTVGQLAVNRLTLAEVKRRVEQTARPKYRTGAITTLLLYPRQFRLTVVGSVNSPGQIVATPVDRLSEVLYLANRLTDLHNRMSSSESGYLLPSIRGSDRNIEIRRLDGTTLRVDLRRYLTTGRLADNPYVADGDVITVPVRNIDGGMVTVAGAVNLPGIYEYAEGDDLGTLFQLSGGLTDSADRSRVEVSRVATDLNGRPHTETIGVDLSQGEPALNTKIKPRDRIFIRTASTLQASFLVTIKGAVRYPGVYPVQPTGVSLSRLMDLAGGFTDDSFVNAGKVLRPLDPNAAPTDPNQARIALLRMSRISPQELADFEAQASLRQQTVVVDFDALFRKQDDRADIQLRPGDIVVIPSKHETVQVTGQVASPGQIPFEPGKDVSYYLALAGGLGKHARDSQIRVIKADTNDWLAPGKTTIEMGDLIWVPRDPQRNYYAIFKETLSVTATLTTLYLVLQQITK